MQKSITGLLLSILLVCAVANTGSAATESLYTRLGGLTAIIENFRVSELWIGRDVASPALARLQELARARGIQIKHVSRGKQFIWDGVEGEFFWPDTPAGDLVAAPKNNDSLVLRLRYGNRTMLLPGDAEKEAERRMLAEDGAEALRADVLKVGHHGSKNSTMPEFLAAVQPRLGIISAGEENPYGHPSPELIQRLEESRVRILRTDRDGAVHVLTDGERIEVSCFVACAESAGSAVARASHSD